jgi:hypothetical protein
VFADVIFPVFFAPYFIFFGLPWAILLALLAEIMIYRFMVKGPSLTATSVFTVSANLISWLFGVFITFFLPDNFARRVIDARGEPAFPAYAVAVAFVVAWALSVLIEGGLWKCVLLKHPELPLWKATAVANAASYALLLGVLFVYNHFSLRLEM